MLMFTIESYETQIELTRKIERHKIANLLRKEAENHPKWEMHNLLQRMAKEVEDAGKTD